MTPTGKIIAVVLEEVNGYTKEEAKKYAKDCEGSITWERIDTIVDNEIAKARREERKKIKLLI